MRKRLGLLPRKDKTPRFRTRQCRFGVSVADLMTFLLGHQFGCAVQALFGLDHVAGGEAVLAATIPTEFDKIGRATHRAHHRVELVDPVAVPMHEHRHVAPREGGLLPRNRVQGGRWIGDDARAVLAGDPPVILGAVGLKLGGLDALRRCADLGLRLQRDALRLKAAMVDPRVDVEFGQAFVDVIGPTLAPMLDQFGAVPVPHLLAEPVVVHAAHGEHDMRMGLGRPVRAHVPMHVEVGDHAPINELGLHEIAGQFDALALRHLAGNGEFDLAGKLGVLAHLTRLDIVPQPLAVGQRLGRTLRQHDFRMHDAAFVGEVLLTAQPLVTQPRP